MKRGLLLLAILLLLMPSLTGQKVDSIKVEQTGDFVKIRYKILNSTPNQLFRVRMLYSMNGGLNIEPRSVSGDTGDNIVGGKNEYFIVWDVLKDVEELSAAEFIVRAELINDLSARNDIPAMQNEKTLRWSKRGFNLMTAVTFPGPKVGFRMGYMGSFGLIGQYSRGTVAVAEVPSIIGMAEYVPHKVAAFSLDISKRIVSFNSFQMHLLAGVHKTTMVFLDPLAMDTPYHDENVLGPEAGFAFGLNYFSMSLLVVHIDPGQVEKKGDLGAMSPLNYFTLNLGVRF